MTEVLPLCQSRFLTDENFSGKKKHKHMRLLFLRFFFGDSPIVHTGKSARGKGVGGGGSIRFFFGEKYSGITGN